MKNLAKTLNKKWDVIVIGSGMGSLTAAALLAKAGKKVVVLERNYLAGGCVSSYYRKGFVFETGATTLVGLDDNMPLRFLLDTIGVTIPAEKLDIPMKVYLSNGQTLTRFNDLNRWIAEAERVFGVKNQRPFWEYCFKVAQFVWATSLKQRTFPPSKGSDFWHILQNFEFSQLTFATTAFISMHTLLKRFDLLSNSLFVDFINEQLNITAQNHISEVNVLFGATALCYTNFGNYYVKGGLINLVQPICDYITAQGGEVLLRVGAEKIIAQNGNYKVILDRNGEGNAITAPRVLSGIPINNTLSIFENNFLKQKYKNKIFPSEKLVSAFSMGIGFERTRPFDCLHHQIHLEQPLPFCGSKSIFLSLNPDSDESRTPSPKHGVCNISTHIHHPEQAAGIDKIAVENAILDTLEKHNFLKRSSIIYKHSATPSTWENWIYRKYGAVGGYPQYFDIKPWQMLEARLDGKGAYICGDTTYPGQGIPGATLSGIIAFTKMMHDWRKNKNAVVSLH